MPSLSERGPIRGNQKGMLNSDSDLKNPTMLRKKKRQGWVANVCPQMYPEGERSRLWLTRGCIPSEWVNVLPDISLYFLHKHQPDHCTHRVHSGPGKAHCYLCRNQEHISEKQKHNYKDMILKLGITVIVILSATQIYGSTTLSGFKNNFFYKTEGEKQSNCFWLLQTFKFLID